MRRLQVAHHGRECADGLLGQAAGHLLDILGNFQPSGRVAGLPFRERAEVSEATVGFHRGGTIFARTEFCLDRVERGMITTCLAASNDAGYGSGGRCGPEAHSALIGSRSGDAERRAAWVEVCIGQRLYWSGRRLERIGGVRG